MRRTCKSILVLLAPALTLCAGLLSLNSNAQGRVYAWGDNTYGQLGVEMINESNTPVQVPGLVGVVAAAGGGEHSLALKTDGTIWAWGNNTYGQLGDGNLVSRTDPAQVYQLSKAVAISAGFWHSLALKSDGTVWAWGRNGEGELGNGTNADSDMPVQVVGLSKIIAISAGMFHNVALKSDGTVWTWGMNGAGQLGNGTNVSSNVPLRVAGLKGIMGVTAGGFHCLAIAGSGNVMAWGFNGYGQLGDGTTVNRSVPVMSLISNVQQVAAGIFHSFAVKDAGTWAWGDETYFQLGDEDGISTKVPMYLADHDPVVQISAGMYDGLALTQANAVVEWGTIDNDLIVSLPEAVTGLPRIASVAAGCSHNLAVEVTGRTPLNLTVSSVVGPKGSIIRLSAAVKSGGAPVSGLSIQFAVDGAPLNGTFLTDSNGQTKALYYVSETLALGAHTLTASIAGDYTYVATSARGTLTVVKGPVQMFVANASGHAGDTIGLWASLGNASGIGLSGQVVSFSIGGHFFGNGITDEVGYVSVGYPIPAGMAKGTYTLSVHFAGNNDHLAGSASGKLTVN